MNIQSIKEEFPKAITKLSTAIVKRDMLKEQIRVLVDKTTSLKQRSTDAKQARIVLQEVARITMQNLEFHLSNLVTLALKSIDPVWPKFVAEIVIRRNKTECDLLFEEDGNRYKPIEGAGGGPLDIASFALRITFWSLRKNRHCFILDEPFRFLSADLQGKASEMLKLISDKLKIQIIMISHQENINLCADSVFLVEKIDKVSHITKVV